MPYCLSFATREIFKEGGIRFVKYREFSFPNAWEKKAEEVSCDPFLCCAFLQMDKEGDRVYSASQKLNKNWFSNLGCHINIPKILKNTKSGLQPKECIIPHDSNMMIEKALQWKCHKIKTPQQMLVRTMTTIPNQHNHVRNEATETTMFGCCRK